MCEEVDAHSLFFCEKTPPPLNSIHKMTISPPSGQQGTQTVEKEEIWSTILTGVASSKMVPTKKLLVLGK